MLTILFLRLFAASWHEFCRVRVHLAVSTILQWLAALSSRTLASSVTTAALVVGAGAWLRGFVSLLRRLTLMSGRGLGLACSGSFGLFKIRRVLKAVVMHLLTSLVLLSVGSPPLVAGLFVGFRYSRLGITAAVLRLSRLLSLWDIGVDLRVRHLRSSRTLLRRPSTLQRLVRLLITHL